MHLKVLDRVELYGKNRIKKAFSIFNASYDNESVW